jgi:NADPH:quinone reductase-like Zn-dependent oxidoreductase
MRSVILESYGRPSDVLTLGDRPVPEPGSGEVRVRMTMSPIHHHDIAIVRGVYGALPPLPAVPGTEAAGVVDALGSGVAGFRIGQRVTIGGGSATWAEYFVAPAHRLVPVPDALPDELACQLVSMPISAMALLDDLQVRPGQWMIQNAANGAVGKTVAMLAASRGIKVVNLVRRDAAIDELAELGITHAVSTEQDGWPDRVRELTGDDPIVCAVDSIGGHAANDVLSVLAEKGLLVSFGAMVGRSLDIGVDNLLFKQATIRGFWLAKRMQEISTDDTARMIGELMQLALSGALRLPVEAAYDLAEASAAIAATAEPGRRGKVVLISAA